MKRSEILETLASLRTDADGQFRPAKDYLRIPLHERILGRDTWLVVGARGMGKTTLHGTLTDGDRRCVDLLGPLWSKTLQSIEGWSGTTKQLPPESVNAQDATSFWLGTLVNTLDKVAVPFKLDMSTLQGRGKPSKFAVMKAAERETLRQWIYDFDDNLGDARIVVSYDALEKISNDWEPYVLALLAFWSDLAPRLKAISPKIFIREDIRDRVKERGADFAKINGRTIPLSWSPSDLFRLLAFLIANASDETRRWLEREGGFEFQAPVGARESFWPLEHMPEEGPGSQDRLAELLGGRIMGRGSNKGLTRRWIPKTLSDGRGAIAPRSATWLLRGAAEQALREGAADSDALFTPDDLREGMRAAARNRAEELKDERGDVVERLERLKGQFVPLREADLAWQIFIGNEGRASLSNEAPGDALTELERLGVIMRRSDGRYDVPDLYRLGFGIKRNGGTALIRRA